MGRIRERVIAIHSQSGGFTNLWIEYCKENGILYKLVNCYESNIISQLKDCHALFWHFHHGVGVDNIMAKNLFFSLSHAGIKIFPDLASMWHFDDKIAQKYLLESIGAPLVPTSVFYTKQSALNWIANAKFPIVWKLRKGAGSSNVKLIETKEQAIQVINKSFTKGFSVYNANEHLKERWTNFKTGKATCFDLLKGLTRLVIKPGYARWAGNEIGYTYFQEFIENNSFDVRIIVIGNKAFGLKRFVRSGDFRASGSGIFSHRKEEFDERCVSLAFDTSKKLKAKCLAYDFVFGKNNEPLIVEISYGFSPHGYFDCEGYWDSDLKWTEGKFNPYGWMVEMIIQD